MATQKRTKTKATQVKEIQQELDVMKFIQQHKKAIIYSVSTVLLIVIFYIFYNTYTTNLENESWYYFSTFLTKHGNAQNVNQSDILELLNKTSDTTAEPWAKYHCISIYFNNNDLDSALKLLNELEEGYQNHYIAKNDVFFENARSILNKEKLWEESLTE